MESRIRQRNQTARGNRADSRSKGAGSKACAATYRTCQLPGGLGLTKKDSWQTKVNLYLKPRYVRAAKWGLMTQLDQTGDGIGGTRFQIACSSDRMVPGVEQVPKGLGIVRVKELREVSTRFSGIKQGDRHQVEANAPGNAGDRAVARSKESRRPVTPTDRKWWEIPNDWEDVRRACSYVPTSERAGIDHQGASEIPVISSLFWRRHGDMKTGYKGLEPDAAKVASPGSSEQGGGAPS
jgi:hypothetical protein